MENITFEKAIIKLEEIVKKISDDKNSLDDSISLYKEAQKLKDICNQKLKNAKMEVENILKKEE
jgi:exodeoxyribonuclease VII small subunit